ncbi:hypothetical protein ES703_119692 [subsurface metagenome]
MSMSLKIEGRDVIALVMLIGAFTLRALGINTITEYIIIGIAVGYGVVQIPRPKGKE